MRKVGTVALTSGRAGEGVLVEKTSLSAAPGGGPRLPEERQPSEATSGPGRNGWIRLESPQKTCVSSKMGSNTWVCHA